MKRAEPGEKDLLQTKEAARYFGIGEVRLRKFLKANPKAEFMVYFRKRRLIFREKFKLYLREHPEIRGQKGGGNE